MSLLWWWILVGFVNAGKNKVEDKTGCPAEFLGRCRCGTVKDRYGEERYEVSCISTEFTNASMLRFLPVQTERLIFKGNYLKELPRNLFGEEDSVPKLEHVDLSENSIRLIHGQTFHHVQSVVRLILNHNSIHVSDRDQRPRVFTNFHNLQELHLTNAFTDNNEAPYQFKDLEYIFSQSEMKKLRTIHMEFNDIEDPDNLCLFCHFPGIEQIHLSDNNLRDFKFNITGLKKLRYIGLQRNKIRRLQNSTMKLFDNFVKKKPDFTLDLDGNPFHCDCKFSPTLNWMKRTQVTLRSKNQYRCSSGYPESNVNEAVMSVNSVRCRPGQDDEPTPQHYSTANVILGILIGLMCALFVFLLYMNRELVKIKLFPIYNYLSKKVRYSSLDEIEEPEAHI